MIKKKNTHINNGTITNIPTFQQNHGQELYDIGSFLTERDNLLSGDTVHKRDL